MSSAGDNPSNFPTMIIPRGTEIKINQSGQLSIKTPGNLVIQNSGTYSELESTNGSIRIEDNVSVEAVSVRCAQACFIQGTLTAWRVHAKKIALEDRAKAYIMLQESETLELSKSSRLVGNFANEKEIYLMLGKFTSQLKQLPGSFDLHSPASLVEPPRTTTITGSAASSGTSSSSFRSEGATSSPSRSEGFSSASSRSEAELPMQLKQALSILEREVRRPDLDAQSSEALREVVFSLRERNLQRTGIVFREAFAELAVPSDALKNAYELMEDYFRNVR